MYMHATAALQRLEHKRLKDIEPFRLRLLKNAVNGTDLRLLPRSTELNQKIPLMN